MRGCWGWLELGRKSECLINTESALKNYLTAYF